MAAPILAFISRGMSHASLTPENFARYAGSNVPRYTSYPTAPAFSPSVGEDEYRTWLAAIPAGTGGARDLTFTAMSDWSAAIQLSCSTRIDCSEL